MIDPSYKIRCADVAAALGVTPETVNRYVRTKRFPPFEAPVSRKRAGRFWFPATLRAHDPDLARLVERFDREGKIVAAVCHGPAGLVSAKKADGTPFVADRRVAGFTDSEERAVGLDQAVPFLLETRLKELGGKHEGGPDFAPFALRDGSLVTGQNPASATPTAELVMEALKDKVA